MPYPSELEAWDGHEVVRAKFRQRADQQPQDEVSWLKGQVKEEFGLTLSGLRQDRILNEAAESAFPLRLMRLFGITEKTAMRYVTAAHPERTAKLPR
ncbi:MULTISPECIES: hypothetical protein [unclassified Streptomyces]|uniref:hypothetical protein n=1 Tax=unclassified Streptomyces TaxID=2593676 RepID=UPI002DD97B22|nr:hypothetical protein [Streptomyces sp. NBC_01445]WSE04627.1 hypothetical protein OG574_15440 [Streptomyces sp. NBC_01445]